MCVPGKWLRPRNLCLAAAVAALYAILTAALAPISYGGVQCRVAEALSVLPILLPEAIPGLFAGCLLANLLSPAPFLADIVFGSLATLAAAAATYALRAQKTWIALLPPVVLNAVVVGMVVHAFFAPEAPVALCMLQVGAGQAAAVYVPGTALLVALRKIDVRRVLRL